MSDLKKERNNGSRLLAICSILSALSVVFLYLGSLIEVLDLSMAMLASFSVILIVIESGGAYPWMIYFATSLLSLIVLPNKTPVLIYALFAGFYPILKSKIERIPIRLLRLVLKLAVFNASLALMALAWKIFLGELAPGVSLVVALILLNAVFLFYDFAFSVMITAYLRVWRKKLRIEKFFNKR